MDAKKKKAQIIGEIFKYGLVLVFAAIVVGAGYKFIASIKDKACKSEIAKFEIELSKLDRNIRYGEKEMRSYKAPCNVDKVYFFDLNKSINPDSFDKIPIIKDSLMTGGTNNIFLIKNGKVADFFYAGNLEIEGPHYICFGTNAGDLNFFIEGLGSSIKITSAPGQRLCN